MKINKPHTNIEIAKFKFKIIKNFGIDIWNLLYENIKNYAIRDSINVEAIFNDVLKSSDNSISKNPISGLFSWRGTPQGYEFW